VGWGRELAREGRGGERREKDEGGEKKVGGQRETRTVCPNGMEGGVLMMAKW